MKIVLHIVRVINRKSGKTIPYVILYNTNKIRNSLESLDVKYRYRDYNNVILKGMKFIVIITIKEVYNRS